MLTIALRGALLLCGLNLACANIIVFTSQSAFNDATSTRLVNFQGLVDSSGATLYPAGLTADHLTFTNPSQYLLVVDPSYSPVFDFQDGNPILSGYGSILMNLPDRTTAVSETIAAFNAASGTVTLSTGDSYLFNISSAPTLTFVGFASTDGQAISSVNFDVGLNGFPQIDTVQYGRYEGERESDGGGPREASGTGEAPEPPVSVLMGLGIAGILASRLRLHRPGRRPEGNSAAV